jgi:putative MFS transporter
VSQIEPYLDDLSFRRAHLRLMLSAGLGIFLDGYDTAMMAVAIVLISRSWHLTPASMGLIGASVLFGAMAGGAIGGRCADLYGRKWLYLIDIATFFLAAILSAFSWNVTSFFVFRFFVGVGIGIDYPLSATFLAEFAPRRRRGSMMTWSFGLFFYIGAVAALLVGYLLSRFGTDAWRLLFASGALPAIGLLILRRTLPESPRWLLREQRPQQAIAALRAFQPDCPLGVEASSPGPAHSHALDPARSRWSELLCRRYLRRTALITLPWFLMDIVDYGYSIYIPTLLLAFGMKSFGGAILLSAGMKCIGTVGFVLVAGSIERVGRIRAQSLGFLGLAAGMTAIALLAMSEARAIVPIALCMVFVKICNAFPDITTWMLPVELFPTDLRASAHGLATSFSRIGAATSVFLFPILQSSWGIGPLLLAIAAAQVLASLLTLLAAYEPAGRSLEDMAPPACAPHAADTGRAAQLLTARPVPEEP